MSAQVCAGNTISAHQHTLKLQRALPQAAVLPIQRRGAPLRLLQLTHAFGSDKQPTAVDSLEDLEIAVPVDQRPVNELSALKEAFLYNWVSMLSRTCDMQRLWPCNMSGSTLTIPLCPLEAGWQLDETICHCTKVPTGATMLYTLL
jgi:hypothetical protein